MTFNERRRQVLKALVTEYIDTGQPVGSKNLVRHHMLDCSPATVRNELAALEETGYVYQPHVSSGRIPTDAGYRAFVDELCESDECRSLLDEVEMRRRYSESAHEIDGLMHETSTVLSHLTHAVAVVLAPMVSRASIRRIDLLSMASHRALLVLITDSGQVVDHHLESAEEITPDRLSEVERALNASLNGKRATEVHSLRGAIDPSRPEDRLMAQVLDEILVCLQEADQNRVYHVGVPELLALPEFTESVRLRPLLCLLEDGLAVLDTFSDVMHTGGVIVRIGRENSRRELVEMSLVATNYETQSADGIVGVIGPTRMNYSHTIAAVRCVADGLSDVLS